MKIPKKQNGAVLLIALVMLTVLSIIVISASSTTVIQQKMTANLRIKEISRQSAESTLQYAEEELLATNHKVLKEKFNNNTAGYYFFDKNRRLNEPKIWEDLQVLTPKNFQYGVKPPNYIIERMPALKISGNSLEFNQAISSHYYRITVMVKSGTTSAVSILQSMIKR